MTNFVRAARKAALAFVLAAAAAAPAYGAEAGVAAAAATEASVSPGIESLEDVVERAIAQPAADEIFSTPAPAVALPTPGLSPSVQSPAMDRSRPLAELVSEYSGSSPRDEQARCLASAVYWESNGEPLAGQLAVAEVIINRAESGRFAGTLCGVITQRSQFSFVRGGRIPTPPQASAGWRNAVAIAHIALDDVADSPVSTALFFHARYVSPRWRLQRLAAVGNHIFYR